MSKQMSVSKRLGLGFFNHSRVDGGRRDGGRIEG